MTVTRWIRQGLFRGNRGWRVGVRAGRRQCHLLGEPVPQRQRGQEDDARPRATGGRGSRLGQASGRTSTTPMTSTTRLESTAILVRGARQGWGLTACGQAGELPWQVQSAVLVFRSGQRRVANDCGVPVPVFYRMLVPGYPKHKPAAMQGPQPWPHGQAAMPSARPIRQPRSLVGSTDSSRPSRR